MRLDHRQCRAAQAVAFSPVDYISATQLLVQRGSGLASYRDLGGKTVVVTAGTTNEKAVRDVLARLQDRREGGDRARSRRLLRDGESRARPTPSRTDDVLLYGLIATDAQGGANYTVLPDKLSYEPYGIMFRKDDPELAGIVAQTFTRLAESRALRWTYERWFLKRLPNGERLDIPMSERSAGELPAHGSRRRGVSGRAGRAPRFRPTGRARRGAR